MFEHELLPRLKVGRLRRIGVVGTSFGAMLGISLLAHRKAVALATLGGVGMTEAWEATAGIRRPVTVTCFANSEDPFREYTLKFAETLSAEGVEYTVVARSGEHRGAEYMANGSTVDAFRAVLGLEKDPIPLP